MILRHAEGKDTLHVLFCQDGTHKEYRQGKGRFFKSMKKLLKFVENCTVSVETWEFEEASAGQEPEDRQRAIQKLKRCDIFYMRGTMGMDNSALGNIVKNDQNEEAVVMLQYKVLFNHTLYMGICGGAKFASDIFATDDGGNMRGLGLLGKKETIHHDEWQLRPKGDGIRFNEVVCTLIDTTLNIVECQVFTKNKESEERKAEYESIAEEMTHKLQHYIRDKIRGKEDHYKTKQGQPYTVLIYDGMWKDWHGKLRRQVCF